MQPKNATYSRISNNTTHLNKYKKHTYLYYPCDFANFPIQIQIQIHSAESFVQAFWKTISNFVSFV